MPFGPRGQPRAPPGPGRHPRQAQGGLCACPLSALSPAWRAARSRLALRGWRCERGEGRGAGLAPQTPSVGPPTALTASWLPTPLHGHEPLRVPGLWSCGQRVCGPGFGRVRAWWAGGGRAVGSSREGENLDSSACGTVTSPPQCCCRSPSETQRRPHRHWKQGRMRFWVMFQIRYSVASGSVRHSLPDVERAELLAWGGVFQGSDDSVLELTPDINESVILPKSPRS